MAYSTINKPTDYFNTLLYTGDMVDGDGSGHTQSITGVGFTPDWVWHKGRSAARPHIIVDSVRGTTNYNTLSSQDSNAESTTNTNGSIKSIDSDGITLEAGTDSSSKAVNAGGNGQTYATWNWLAGGSASSNTDGSITSSVSANTTSGLSIVTYTGTGANASVGHGLGAAPTMLFIKKRSAAGGDWVVSGDNVEWTKYLYLNSTQVRNTNNFFQNTAPTSSVFTLSSDGGVNQSSTTFVAYCFAEKKGFSKFGSYSGNLSDDGTFVYTGFAPAFVMIKGVTTATSWIMFDNKREPSNPTYKRLHAELGDAEYTTAYGIDMLSNGFKFRTSDNSFNHTNTYMYMAFAERSLVGTNNVPALAR